MTYDNAARAKAGRMVGVGAGMVVFALAMLVLAVAGHWDILVTLEPSVPLAVLAGGLCRMVVDDDWPAFRGRANEAEAARELRHHEEMASLPAVDLGVPEVDRTTDGELRVVYSHRAPRQRKERVR